MQSPDNVNNSPLQVNRANHNLLLRRDYLDAHVIDNITHIWPIYNFSGSMLLFLYTNMTFMQ